MHPPPQSIKTRQIPPNICVPWLQPSLFSRIPLGVQKTLLHGGWVTSCEPGIHQSDVQCSAPQEAALLTTLKNDYRWGLCYSFFFPETSNPTSQSQLSSLGSPYTPFIFRKNVFRKPHNEKHITWVAKRFHPIKKLHRKKSLSNKDFGCPVLLVLFKNHFFLS